MTAAEPGCAACEALRAAGPSILPYLTTSDTPLCGFHASELQKQVAELRVENAEVLHALHHHTDCNDAKQAKAERDAANARVEELEGLLRAATEHMETKPDENCAFCQAKDAEIEALVFHRQQEMVLRIKAEAALERVKMLADSMKSHAHVYSQADFARRLRDLELK